MKAFKTFEQCPQNQRPNNIPLEWPWQEQDCSVEQQAELEGYGFTVMSEEDYANYKAENTAAYNSWVSSQVKIPSEVTPRQMRIALVMSGISLDTIDAAINSLPEPQKSITRITWEYSISFQRSNPLLVAIAPMLGMSSAQIDALFTFASTL